MFCTLPSGEVQRSANMLMAQRPSSHVRIQMQQWIWPHRKIQQSKLKQELLKTLKHLSCFVCFIVQWLTFCLLAGFFASLLGCWPIESLGAFLERLEWFWAKEMGLSLHLLCLVWIFGPAWWTNFWEKIWWETTKIIKKSIEKTKKHLLHLQSL